MRNFKDGETVTIEPWRAAAFPVVKDLVVDRAAFDRIIQAGGFISVHTRQRAGRQRAAVPKQDADRAMDAAACIGCGACVAACPNASAMLFTAAKVGPPRPAAAGPARAPLSASRAWSTQMDAEGFGACTNHGECEAVCPKEISIDFIAKMNRDLIGATLRGVKG